MIKRIELNLYELSLNELEEMVNQITMKQEYIATCGLSKAVTTLAIEELQNQKGILITIMYKKVDML